MTATTVRNATPTAASWDRPDRSSCRLGLTSADSRRQLAAELMMVEDDHIEPEVARGGERLEAGRAAIDGDDQRRSRRGELAERFGVRAIALEDAVGNVEDRVAALVAEEPREKRHRGRPVDVIVAEDRNRRAGNDGVGDARRRPVHVGQDRRVGHQHLQRRGQERRRGIGVDAAAGKHPRDDVGNAVPLGDGERGIGAGAIQPVDPAPAGQRTRHAEEGAMLIGTSAGAAIGRIRFMIRPSYRPGAAVSFLSRNTSLGRFAQSRTRQGR